MRLKIAFCNHFARSNWLDGAEVSLLQIISALPSAEFEKFLITPNNGEMPQIVQRMGIPVHIAPLSLMWSMGGISRPEQSRFPSIQRQLQHLLTAENRVILQYKQFLKTIRPQLLLVNTSVNVLPAVIGKQLGIKTIWFPREYFRGNLQETCRILDQYSDQIWVASQTMEKLLQASPQLTPKLRKIPNFIDLTQLEETRWPDYRQEIRSRYGLTPAQTAICYWSSISPMKGIIDFIAMAKQLKEQHGPKAKFFVAGCASQDIYLQQAKAKSTEFGLDDDLVFTGFFPYSQQCLPGMDIVVHPSHFAETFSRSALDAMTYRKPLIAYNSGALAELIVHQVTGYLVTKGDVQGLGKACAALIADPGLRETMGNAGRRIVEERYSAAQVLPLMLNALGKLRNTGRSF